ncbi:MAG TPA: hypothetical protein PKY81_14920 [bacterium]|nr:hypothetical protein [bacterium]
MSFNLYSQTEVKGEIEFKNLQIVRLGGKNFKAIWEKKEKPLNMGWKINESDYLSIYNLKNEITKPAIIINICPDSDDKAELYQLLEIFVYTYSEKQDSEKPRVNYLMLKLKEIVDTDCPEFLENFSENNFKVKKEKLEISETVYEFLYLFGDSGKWKWGRNGSVNTPLLYNDALQYFINNISLKSRKLK